MVEVISATHLARSIVRQLLELGVTDFVLSPGSRNAPLSVALYEAAERGLLDLHVRIDERGAAFFGLGISKASNNYVALICTSGTAAANYHPAALEALHNNNKLIFITADRPESLRKTGANQTTEQAALYPHVKSFDIAEIMDLSKALTDGPVQLNVQFSEPLVVEDGLDWLAGFTSRAQETVTAEGDSVDFGTGGVLVIGHDRAGFSVAEIENFADHLNWPIVAEDPLSFPTAIAHSALFLADEKVRALLHPARIVVIGRTTLSRSINAYVQGASEVSVIDPRMAEVDSARQADHAYLTMPRIQQSQTEDPTWKQLWESISHIAHTAIVSEVSWSEQEAVRTIAAALADESALFIGSSRPIRDIEAFAEPRAGISVFANRGLAGIDGNISTALGIATRFERAYAVMGDLTFLHDISALVNIPKVNLTIFVLDNNGGGIFSTLPHAEAKGFETIFGTAHNNDLARIVRGFGIPADRVKTSSDIKSIIAHQSPGVDIVVVEVPDRDFNAAKLKELTQIVSSAVRIGNNLD